MLAFVALPILPERQVDCSVTRTTAMVEGIDSCWMSVKGKIHRMSFYFFRFIHARSLHVIGHAL
jgi:hypothetical protein